jgi:hypothetical protein
VCARQLRRTVVGVTLLATGGVRQHARSNSVARSCHRPPIAAAAHNGSRLGLLRGSLSLPLLPC